MALRFTGVHPSKIKNYQKLMKINPLKTHVIKPGASLHEILDEAVPLLAERAIVAITSKIISLCQGRVVPKDSVQSKRALVEEEADAYLREGESLYKAEHLEKPPEMSLHL